MKPHHLFAGLISSLWILGTSGSALGQDTEVRAYVANFGGDGISVIDVAGRRLITHVKTGSKPHGVGVAPDGKAVYVSNEGDGTLSIIDPATNKVTDTIEVGAEPNQLAVSADGRHVFVALHADGAVAVVDVTKRQIAQIVLVGRTPHIALRSHDGKTIYVTSEGDMKLVALDAASWKITGETPLLAFPRVLAIKADDSRIFQTIRWLNGALVIDPAKRMVVDRVALGEPIFATEGKDAHGLAVTPDGDELWLTTQTTNDVTFINAHDLSILGRLNVGTDPNWVDFSPDGKLGVVSNTGSGDVSIVNVAGRKVVATVKVGTAPKRVAVGSVVVK